MPSFLHRQGKAYGHNGQSGKIQKESGKSEKSQIQSANFQINPNLQNSKFKTVLNLNYLNFEFVPTTVEDPRFSIGI